MSLESYAKRFESSHLTLKFPERGAPESWTSAGSFSNMLAFVPVFTALMLATDWPLMSFLRVMVYTLLATTGLGGPAGTVVALASFSDVVAFELDVVLVSPLVEVVVVEEVVLVEVVPLELVELDAAVAFVVVSVELVALAEAVVVSCNNLPPLSAAVVVLELDASVVLVAVVSAAFVSVVVAEPLEEVVLLDEEVDAPVVSELDVVVSLAEVVLELEVVEFPDELEFCAGLAGTSA
jgi:hypothetical protein